MYIEEEDIMKIKVLKLIVFANYLKAMYTQHYAIINIFNNYETCSIPASTKRQTDKVSL